MTWPNNFKGWHIPSGFLKNIFRCYCFWIAMWIVHRLWLALQIWVYPTHAPRATPGTTHTPIPQVVWCRTTTSSTAQLKASYISSSAPTTAGTTTPSASVYPVSRQRSPPYHLSSLMWWATSDPSARMRGSVHDFDRFSSRNQRIISTHIWSKKDRESRHVFYKLACLFRQPLGYK